jgi:hypothetical protein
MSTDRALPTNIYPNGKGYISVIRHNGVRRYLGASSTIEDAQALCDAFRAENPKRKSKRWMPGDIL